MIKEFPFLGILFFCIIFGIIYGSSNQNNFLMRNFLFLVFVLFSTLSYAQDSKSELNWLTNLERAKKVSKKEHKPILIYFTGSDWCSPCIMLKKDFFNSSEFEKKAKGIILVMIDLPRRLDIISEKQLIYNKKIIEKYNSEKTFPKLVMLDHKGKLLGKISGYGSLRTTDNHFAFLDQYISKY